MIPKFRFFDKGYKVWLHPDQVWLDETGAFRGVDGVTRFEPVGGDLVVMQSTGLFDKNGVEIFEGDVVTYRGDSYIVAKKDAAIGLAFLRNKEMTSFKPLVDDLVNFDKLEVISNIYEHPELVEMEEIK